MFPYPNLISDSLLINETINFLQSAGGYASAVEIVDYVMKIRHPAPDLAKILIKDLIESDPRLKIVGDEVRLVERDFSSWILSESEYVVFDLETTGAKTPPCRITEIGAYRVKNGKIVDEFHTLVNPETPIPIFIAQLTGISDAMVKNEPKFREIAHDFLEFIGDSVLVAHNAHFDIRFLNHEIARIHGSYRVGNPHLCTVQLSRKLLPHIENHRLNTVAEYYSVALLNHHRASDDARATAHIFINLLAELDAHGISDLGGARNLKKNLSVNIYQ